MSSTLQGGVLITGPPGRPWCVLFFKMPTVKALNSVELGMTMENWNSSVLIIDLCPEHSAVLISSASWTIDWTCYLPLSVIVAFHAASSCFFLGLTLPTPRFLPTKIMEKLITYLATVQAGKIPCWHKEETCPQAAQFWCKTSWLFCHQPNLM